MSLTQWAVFVWDLSSTLNNQSNILPLPGCILGPVGLESIFSINFRVISSTQLIMSTNCCRQLSSTVITISTKNCCHSVSTQVNRHCNHRESDVEGAWAVGGGINVEKKQLSETGSTWAGPSERKLEGVSLKVPPANFLGIVARGIKIITR